MHACDQDLDLLFHLRSGAFDCLLAQDTRTMGARALEMINAMRKGQPVAQRQIVSPVLITRQNVDTEQVQNVLTMDWRGIK